MRHESGASVVLVAAVFMLLLGMAAIAIDVGVGFNERRASQTASDVGALAGAIEFLNFDDCDLGDGDACTRVLEVVRENLSVSYSDPAEYAAVWRECRDPGRPGSFGRLPVSGVAPWDSFQDGVVDCISASFSEIRVRLPDQFIDTSFGRALGADQIATFAVAHAGIVFGEGASPIVPFGALSGAAGHDCLLEPPNGFADPPCVGGETGSYGALLTQIWGSDGSIANCGNSSWPPGANQLMFSIAYGMDHPIASLSDDEIAALPGDADAFDQAVNNNDAEVDEITILDRCTYLDGEPIPWDRLNGTAADVGPVDTVRVDSGASMSDATLKGFITGRAADFTGRAVDPNQILPRIVGSFDCDEEPAPHPEDPSPEVTNFLCLTVGANTQLVDSTPLWSHLSDSFTIPAACDEQSDGEEGFGEVNTSTEMDCVLKSPEVSGSIFEDSIKYNRRFVWVPEFHYTDWGTGIGWQPIARFKSAYIHAFWFNTPGADFRWAPEEDDNTTLSVPITNPNALITVTAFLIPDDVLPPDIADDCPTCDDADFDVELRR